MASPGRLPLQEVYKNLNALQDQGSTVLFSTLRNYIFANSEAENHAVSQLLIQDSAYPSGRVIQDVPFLHAYGSNPGTHVVVADSSSDGVLTTKFERYDRFGTVEDFEMLDKTLSHRAENVQGRIIFTSAVSGVDVERRRNAQHDSILSTGHANGPVRAPVALGINPLRGNTHGSPSLHVLSIIARHTTPDPDLLLRYIYDTTHLTDKVCLKKDHILNCGRKVSSWKELHICVDDANQFFVAIRHEIKDGPWTSMHILRFPID